MKTLILVLICNIAQAKEFTFKYQLNGQKLEIKKQDENWETAYEFAALQCFKFFTKDKPYSEKYGLDVIDTCANPIGNDNSLR